MGFEDNWFKEVPFFLTRDDSSGVREGCLGEVEGFVAVVVVFFLDSERFEGGRGYVGESSVEKEGVVKGVSDVDVFFPGVEWVEECWGVFVWAKVDGGVD